MHAHEEHADTQGARGHREHTHTHPEYVHTPGAQGLWGCTSPEAEAVRGAAEKSWADAGPAWVSGEGAQGQHRGFWQSSTWALATSRGPAWAPQCKEVVHQGSAPEGGLGPAYGEVACVNMGVGDRKTLCPTSHSLIIDQVFQGPGAGVHPGAWLLTPSPPPSIPKEKPLSRGRSPATSVCGSAPWLGSSQPVWPGPQAPAPPPLLRPPSGRCLPPASLHGVPSGPPALCPYRTLLRTLAACQQSGTCPARTRRPWISCRGAGACLCLPSPGALHSIRCLRLRESEAGGREGKRDAVDSVVKPPWETPRLELPDRNPWGGVHRQRHTPGRRAGQPRSGAPLLAAPAGTEATCHPYLSAQAPSCSDPGPEPAPGHVGSGTAKAELARAWRCVKEPGRSPDSPLETALWHPKRDPGGLLLPECPSFILPAPLGLCPREVPGTRVPGPETDQAERPTWLSGTRPAPPPPQPSSVSGTPQPPSHQPLGLSSESSH
ncbi:basic proline-rich protein-like [Meles meles]|uniref:basic proline-rich protein-like n=1 Tax=Meles meles TaxID=9662 RepID=UPI001E69CD87|nr:basic proline-rich protein-like [Meles meles]